MKNKGLFRRLLIFCLVFVVLGAGLTASPEAAGAPVVGRKVEYMNGKKVEYFKVRDRQFKRYSLGERTKLWEKIGSEGLIVDNFSPDYPYYGPVQLEKIEEDATDIVLGSFLEDVTQTVMLDAYSSETIRFGATAASFQIEKVFKGSLKEGEKISVCEVYYIDTWEGQEYLKIIDSYLPSKPGVQYLLFLTAPNKADFYTPDAYELGDRYAKLCYARYPVLTPKQKERGISKLLPYEFSMTGVGQVYLSMYDEVARKYGL